ncbi:MAG: phosphorylcholine transferase LicD [Aristaeellaceae bacterium]
MSTSIRDIQQVELELLKELKYICEKYDISYFLAYGTLLGAVRHGGFIPWDDDVDVLMRASDLKRFEEAFRKEHPEGCTLQCFREQSEVPHTWDKLRKRGTTSMPRRYQKIPVDWGICIDLFPYFEVADGKLAHFLAKLRQLIAKRMLGVTMTFYEDKVKITSRLVRRLPVRFRAAVAGYLMDDLERHQKKGKDILAEGQFFPREWFDGESREMEFEGIPFRVPSNSDAFLTEMYGDYMSFPPEDERRGHELQIGEIVWDTQHSYQEYLDGTLPYPGNETQNEAKPQNKTR